MGQSLWNTVEFHQQEIFLDIGTIWIIQDLGLSGIVDYERFGGNPHRHYVRRDTRKIVDYLTAQLSNFTNANRPISQRIPAGQIVGGSGVGKSTECWGWSHNVPYNRMWIHNDSKTDFVFTVVKVSHDLLGNWIWKHQVAESFEAVKTALKSANIRVAVFDGTFQKDPMNRFAEICSKKNIFHVTCTSGQSVPLSAARASQFCYGKTFIVEGFTRDEYLAAEGFLHPDRTVDDIHRMYYFAGGSARYFFQYFDSIGDLCNLFRSKIRRILTISNYSAFFSGAVGDSSIDAVNSLTTYRNGNTDARPVLVSKFVVRLLFESADMNFINAAKDVYWQGWCTELDFFIRV
jgi:hypothetical protein